MHFVMRPPAFIGIHFAYHTCYFHAEEASLPVTSLFKFSSNGKQDKRHKTKADTHKRSLVIDNVLKMKVNTNSSLQ